VSASRLVSVWGRILWGRTVHSIINKNKKKRIPWCNTPIFALCFQNGMRYHNTWIDTISFQHVREILTLADFYVTPKWVLGILIPNCTDNNHFMRKSGVDLQFLYLSSLYVDWNNKGINHCQIQLMFIMYFILATLFDPLRSSSGQKYKIHKLYCIQLYYRY